MSNLWFNFRFIYWHLQIGPRCTCGLPGCQQKRFIRWSRNPAWHDQIGWNPRRWAAIYDFHPIYCFQYFTGLGVHPS